MVLGAVDEWVREMGEIMKEVRDANEKRVAFDHYRDKVEALRAAGRASQLKGRVVGKGEMERMARNVEKLSTSEAAYLAARDRTVGRLALMIYDANTHVETLLQRVMQFESQLAKGAAACISRNGPASRPISRP